MLRVKFAILCVLMCLGARADYRILYLNTPAIEIGGRTLTVNDRFKSAETIRWTSPKQAMKVADMSTGEVLVFVADDFSGSKAQTARMFVERTKADSAASSGSSGLSSLAAVLNDSFYLLDSLDIATGVPTDDLHYFFIAFTHCGQELIRAVPNSDGVIRLTPEIFYFRGIFPREELRVKVYYYDKSADKVTAVCDNMRIKILPRKIK